MTQSADLSQLLERCTPGPWRLGADLMRVHPHWRDEHGNMAPECVHRNGYAKTIATVINDEKDWRDIGAAVADGELITLAPELAKEVLRLREAAGLLCVKVDEWQMEEAEGIDVIEAACAFCAALTTPQEEE